MEKQWIQWASENSMLIMLGLWSVLVFIVAALIGFWIGSKRQQPATVIDKPSTLAERIAEKLQKRNDNQGEFSDPWDEAQHAAPSPNEMDNRMETL